jgi:hypothetical protein
MNGGLGHAFDLLNEEDLNNGKGGYVYFGLPQVARLLEAAKTMEEEMREEFGDSYSEFIPNDSSLIKAFERRFRSSPDDFAPVR